jgi:outer membrane scaffolding protein for murein synthesis (MipA/OmpV family)
MKGLRLLIAIVFGVTLMGSAFLFCTAAQGGSTVGSIGAGGEALPESQPKAKGTQVQLGLGAGLAPDYEGSVDYRGVPLVFARVARESGMFLHLEAGSGLRVNLVPSPNWRLGPVVKYIPARDDVEDKKVDELKDVDAAVMLGGFAGYDIDRWSIFVQVVQDVAGGNDGLVATLGLGYTIPLSDQLLVNLGVTTNYASGDYMSTYFGIDEANSLRSGLKTYNADPGFKDVGVGVLVQYWPWGNLGLRFRAGYVGLVGDAADSPVVKDRGDENQLFGGLMVTYRF